MKKITDRGHLELNRYYLLTKTDKSVKAVVFYYKSPYTNQNGFGFNIADGGSFLKISDVAADSLIYLIEEIEPII